MANSILKMLVEPIARERVVNLFRCQLEDGSKHGTAWDKRELEIPEDVYRNIMGVIGNMAAFNLPITSELLKEATIFDIVRKGLPGGTKEVNLSTLVNPEVQEAFVQMFSDNK